MPDTQGLMSLLNAMQSGLDPSTGYSMMQDLQAQQEAQQQQRMDRQSGLIGMLQEAAMGGMPYAGAEALLDSAPGPMGPALQQSLSAMYPEGGPPPTGPDGQVLDFPTGSGATVGSGGFGGQAAPGTPNPYASPTAQPTGPDAMSPAFVPSQPSPTEMLAVDQAQQEASTAADWAKVQQQLGAARAANKPLDAVMAAMTSNPAYAAVIGQDPGQFQKMVEITYGPAALDMLGVAPQL